MKFGRNPLRAPCLLWMAALASLPAWGAGPDAGQASRDVLPPTNFALPDAVPQLIITESGAPSVASQSQQRIFIKRVQFTGNQAITTPELQGLVADLEGRELDFGDLQQGAARVSALYRARGFVVARAILPPQEIRDGVIEIQVLEGAYGIQILLNQSRVATDNAKRYLSNLRFGDVIFYPQLERAMQLVGDTPGVGAARATLQPGISVGHADLLIELDPAQAYAINLEADNYGNRFVGEYRVGAALAVNSPLAQGDLLSLRALTSGEQLNYLRAAYQIPLGGDGLKVGAAVADTRYKLGQEFAPLQQSGTATSNSVFVSYPLIRSRAKNLFATLSWEGKKLQDQSAAVGSNDEKSLNLWTLEWSGNRVDNLGGGGLMAFTASWTSGDLAMDPLSLARDRAPGSANTHGAFSKLTYAVQRAQRLGADYSVVAVVSGQQADRNLSSSEKFSLGGANGVRAYPQGEGNGDSGVMLNLDVRRNFSRDLQALVFYDTGSVSINHTPYAGGANERSIAGVGFGLIGQIGNAQIKGMLAWPTEGGDPVSDTERRTPRLWLQVSAPL